VQDVIVVGRRFRGPLTSANGGYVAGALAARLQAETVEVTLRLPPPLECRLDIRVEDGSAVLLRGSEVVAQARAAELELSPPHVTVDEAEAATARHVRWGDGSFSECFSCGVRPQGDGLAIHPGPVPGRDPLHAAPWTARDVAPETVWSAIDCSGAYALRGLGRGDAVLGRMTARIERLPGDGEQCVVVGWRLEEEGRKLHAATALLGRDGALLALARQIWIAPRATSE
jgi:hypothetical protein